MDLIYWLKESADERPWLWAVYGVLVLLPVTVLTVCCCPSFGIGIKVILGRSFLIFFSLSLIDLISVCNEYVGIIFSEIILYFSIT